MPPTSPEVHEPAPATRLLRGRIRPPLAKQPRDHLSGPSPSGAAAGRRGLMAIPASRGSPLWDAMIPFRFPVPVTLACLLPTALAVAAPTRVAAQSFTDPQFGTDVIASLPQFTPVGIDWSPDGRLFILQKHGVVRVVRDGALLPTPFLDISHKVNGTHDSGPARDRLSPRFRQQRLRLSRLRVRAGRQRNDAGRRTPVWCASAPIRPTGCRAARQRDSDSRHVCQGSGPGRGLPVRRTWAFIRVGTLRFAADGKLMVGNGDGG